MNRCNILLLIFLALVGVAKAQRAAVSLGSRLKNRFGRRNSHDDSAIIEGEERMIWDSWMRRPVFVQTTATLVLIIVGYAITRKRKGKRSGTHANCEDGELPSSTVQNYSSKLHQLRLTHFLLLFEQRLLSLRAIMSSHGQG